MLNIYDCVKESNSVGITAHIGPDGDAIGATLAMYLYLKKRMPGKNIRIILDSVEDCFGIMPGIEHIELAGDDFDEDVVFDSFIVIDCAKDRIGKLDILFDKAKHTVNIDHHISNKDGCAEMNYVVPQASSASELVFNTMDKEYLDADIASLLYMGIAHDTGVFRYNNTKPDTMRAVASLLEYNFDFSRIIDVTFYEKTMKQNKLQGQIVLDSRLFYDGRLIVGVADEQLVEQYEATKGDFDGVVNQLLLTKGVETAVFMYPKMKGVYKLSLRSCTDTVDVSAICMKLGGGGHIRAAGVDYTGTWQEAMEKVVGMIGECFNK